jgi:undecaprenyl-diphosphatase
MTLFETINFGVVQGMTEFLPVSSSGHLRLGQLWLQTTPPSLFFDIALHLGTLLAVVVVFRRSLWNLTWGLLRPGQGLWWHRPQGRQLGLLLLASVPTALIGLALEPLVEERLGLSAVGGLLLINGVILLFAKPLQGAPSDVGEEDQWALTWKGALLIGVAQGLAVLPGISRSGSTIVMGLAMGMSARAAATFSFLLSIPAILGAALLKSRDLESFEQGEILITVAGSLVAAVVGYLALVLLLALIKRAQFHHFSWYCFLIGAFALTTGLM